MVDLLFEFDDCLVISKGVEEILFAFINEKGFSIEDYSNAFYVLQNIMNYNNKTMNNILHKLEEIQFANNNKVLFMFFQSGALSEFTDFKFTLAFVIVALLGLVNEFQKNRRNNSGNNDHYYDRCKVFFIHKSYRSAFTCYNEGNFSSRYHTNAYAQTVFI